MTSHNPKEVSEEHKAADHLITYLIPRSLRVHLLKSPGMGHIVMANLANKYMYFLLKRLSVSKEASFSYLGYQGKETDTELSFLSTDNPHRFLKFAKSFQSFFSNSASQKHILISWVKWT